MKRLSIVLLILSLCAVTVISEETDKQQAPYIHLNKVIDKLERGIVSTGIWCEALHPTNAIGLVRQNKFKSYEESLTKPMIDFIIIDMEHKPYEINELRNFLLAMNSKREVMIKGNLQPSITTIVRIPVDGDEHISGMVKQVLDAGVQGVIVPHIRTAAQAEKVVQACRYIQPKGSEIEKPIGRRGAAPTLCAYLWGIEGKEYIKRADVWPLNPKGDLLAIIMIEDVQGVDNIDKILNVKGIGAVFFGPFDYSFSAGLYGDMNHPKVVEAEKKVKQACDRHKVPMIAFANSKNIKERLKENQKMLMIGSDVKRNGEIKAVLDAIAESK